MLVRKYILQVLGIGQKWSVITFLEYNCYPVENTRKLILLLKANIANFFYTGHFGCVYHGTLLDNDSRKIHCAVKSLNSELHV